VQACSGRARDNGIKLGFPQPRTGLELGLKRQPRGSQRLVLIRSGTGTGIPINTVAHSLKQASFG
jgi:two-component sensor histidine kinase